jgi:hypothetical protein
LQVTRPHRWDFPCCVVFRVCMPSSLPRWDRIDCRSCFRPPRARSLVCYGGGLPRFSGRSAPTSPFSRPARRSLALRPANSLSRLATLCHRRLRQFCHLHCRSDCFRLERPFAGRDLHPREYQHLSRRTEKYGLAARHAHPSRPAAGPRRVLFSPALAAHLFSTSPACCDRRQSELL